MTTYLNSMTRVELYAALTTALTAIAMLIVIACEVSQ